MRNVKIILALTGIALMVTFLFSFWNHLKGKTSVEISVSPNPVLLKTEPHDILSDLAIDSVLNSLAKIPFENIESGYLEFSGYDKPFFRIAMSGRTFYKLRNQDLSKKLVGKFTIADFMPKDSRLRKIHPEIDSSTYYFGMEKYVLHRFLDLILTLKNMGYNDEALMINDGYRYPSFNEYTGGVSGSQHLFGRAIDIAVGDINNDGNYNENFDKKIVLSLIENDIIKNTGGVGRYPNTNVVHFDTRGKYKRWDNQ